MKGITGNRTIDAYARVGSVGGAPPAARPEAASTTAAPNPSAQVSISSRARDMATEAAEQTVDVAKVDALRQRIAEGGFSIDPQHIAAQMMQQLA